MEIPFTLPMGFLFTVTMGILLTASLPDLAGGSRQEFDRRPNFSRPVYECGSGRFRMALPAGDPAHPGSS